MGNFLVSGFQGSRSLRKLGGYQIKQRFSDAVTPSIPEEHFNTLTIKARGYVAYVFYFLKDTHLSYANRASLFLQLLPQRKVLKPVEHSL